ncbi:MAG: hypothetical protein ACYDA1_04180 [Vulcanimicrobiaceae bacterium]
MTIALVVVLVAIAVLLVARFAARRPQEPARVSRVDVAEGDVGGFDRDSAAEFDRLPENARCEMLFSVALLDDERSRALLEHALADASSTVSLAAARGLVASGRGSDVSAYLSAHPGERSDALAAALQLFDIDRD